MLIQGVDAARHWFWQSLASGFLALKSSSMTGEQYFVLLQEALVTWKLTLSTALQLRHYCAQGLHALVHFPHRSVGIQKLAARAVGLLHEKLAHVKMFPRCSIAGIQSASL